MADILPTQTITYKSVNGLDIALDVYLPSNANRVPVLLWFHGGGLLYVLKPETLSAHIPSSCPYHLLRTTHHGEHTDKATATN